MILEALMRIYEREGLDEALHFAAKHKHVAIHLTKTGKYRKEIREGHPVRTPWPHSRTSNVRPNLLSDSHKYFGGQNLKKWKGLKEYHDRLAANAGEHPAIKAIQAFFKKGPYGWEEDTLNKVPLDYVFYFEKTPVCEIPELYEAIRKTLREEFTYSETPCRFDDNPCILDPHMKVNLAGMSNAQALLGFNKNVTWNGVQDADKMLMAGMSYEAMRAYTGGLEWLHGNRTLPRIHIKDGDQITLLGWTESEHRIESVLRDILRGCPKDTPLQEHRDRVQSALDDDQDLFGDTTRFNLLMLLTGKRAAVRGFHVMTVAELAQRLVAYLDDFSVERDEVRVRTMTPPYAVLAAGEPHYKITPRRVESLYNSIFLGDPYPRFLDQVSIQGYLREVTKASSKDRDLFPEAALHAIARRHTQDNTEDNMTKYNKKHPSYLAGRLFGAMEIRNEAAKDKGDKVSITAKFRHASINQMTVVSNLMRLTGFHQEKLESRKRRTMDETFSEIFDELDQALEETGEELPKRATQREQFYFTMGRQAERRVQTLNRKARIEAALRKEAEKKAREDLLAGRE